MADPEPTPAPAADPAPAPAADPAPAPAPAADPAPAPAADPPATWFTGKVDEETVGYLKNRGWDTKTGAEVALESIKAHREAERLLGAPAAELIRLPKDANDPAWAGIYQRLGKPANAGEYDFSGVKHSDGAELDATLVAAAQQRAFDMNFTKQQAIDWMRGEIKSQETIATAKEGEQAAKLATEKDTLKTNWGANFEVNKLVARNAAVALGVKEADMDALENVVGYASVMEIFRNIGQRIGEDKFIVNPNKPNAAMTRDQAVSQLAELKKDKAWTDKLLAGDTKVKREYDDIQAIISGVSVR